ncbi:MAG: molybdopterin cofactor-binding domain-containing protein [Candidatus Izemoplasmatales bacterium]
MNVVNKPLPSLDGKAIMMGRPAYTDDFTAPQSLAVKILRSPHPFARIVAIDLTEARAIPGVELVLTHKDFPRVPFTRAGQGYPEPSPHDKFVLDEYVRYVGDEVAIVAASDVRTAEAAIAAIKVQYELLTPVLDLDTAVDNPSVLHPEPEIHEMFPIGFEPKRNIAASYKMNVGDVDAVLKTCDVVVKRTYRTTAQAHVAMEPHAANARFDHQNRLVIHATTQTPMHVRRILSQALGYPIANIRVIKPRVGGGFGGKQAIAAELAVATVAIRTGRPCRLVFTRKEVFESSYTRHPMRIEMTLGAMKDGTLKAIDCQVLSDTGAYGEHALTVFMVTGSKVLPLYNKVDAVRFGGIVAYTNHTPAGAFRGYGAIQGNFALESAVDELCAELKCDPLAFRRKNMMREGETSPIFAIMGEGTEGTAMTMDTCKLPFCVDRGAELSDWAHNFPRRIVARNRVRAVGMAIAMQGSGIPLIDMASATIKLNDDGFYNLLVGATDIGQKSDTVLAQIAAEELGTTLDRMVVTSSDTDVTPFDTGAYASSTTYVSGNAVLCAARKMKEALVAEAAEVLGTTRDQVAFDGEKFVAESGRTTLRELANRLYYNQGQKQLCVTGSFVGHKSPPPFMAGFATVEVDTETGEVDLIDYVSVVDCGTTINPKLAQGQVEGAIVQGLGIAMFEEPGYAKDGRTSPNDLLQYKIPTRLDIPKLTTEFAVSYEESGPFGAKSVGEIGIDTPPAAIANAIYHAVGVRIRELPVTPEKIWRGLQARQAK